MKFSKPALLLDDQVKLLSKRGMIIDIPDAERILGDINYYRFSGYALHFEKFNNRQRTHIFYPETKFSDVIKLHDFDHELRNLISKYLSVIEIKIRTVICYEMVHKYKDPHCYLKKEIFEKEYFFTSFINIVRDSFNRSKEVFVQAYKNKYTDPYLPPLWMVIELISFGQCSKLYKGLSSEPLKRTIAEKFNCWYENMESWLMALSGLRNHCAHHSRVWNKKFQIRPKIPRKCRKFKLDNQRIISFYVAILKLLNDINLQDDFNQDFNKLLNKYSEFPKKKMGFTKYIDIDKLYKTAIL